MDRDFTARSNHDMGGMMAGAINKDNHNYVLWEKRVDAMMMLLSNDLGILTVDQLRKGIESLPPDAYDKMTYYERWMASIANALLESGVLTTEELGVKINWYELVSTGEESKIRKSISYPNLQSEYVIFEYKTRFSEEHFNKDGYIEIQKDKKTYFKWMTHNKI